MKRHRPEQKKQRATAWTDFCRLLLCGVGCFFIAVSTIGFLDEERPWPLTAMLFCVAMGLVLMGVGIFAKPKVAERVAESIGP